MHLSVPYSGRSHLGIPGLGFWVRVRVRIKIRVKVRITAGIRARVRARVRASDVAATLRQRSHALDNSRWYKTPITLFNDNFWCI